MWDSHQCENRTGLAGYGRRHEGKASGPLWSIEMRQFHAGWRSQDGLEEVDSLLEIQSVR